MFWPNDFFFWNIFVLGANIENLSLSCFFFKSHFNWIEYVYMIISNLNIIELEYFYQYISPPPSPQVRSLHLNAPKNGFNHEAFFLSLKCLEIMVFTRRGICRFFAYLQHSYCMSWDSLKIYCMSKKSCQVP